MQALAGDRVAAHRLAMALFRLRCKLISTDAGPALDALERLRDRGMDAIAAAHAAKARLLQHDRAAVEARVAAWACAAGRIATAAGEGVQRACAEAMAALDQTWVLRCGHAGAPWLSLDDADSG